MQQGNSLGAGDHCYGSRVKLVQPKSCTGPQLLPHHRLFVSCIVWVAVHENGRLCERLYAATGATAGHVAVSGDGQDVCKPSSKRRDPGKRLPSLIRRRRRPRYGYKNVLRDIKKVLHRGMKLLSYICFTKYHTPVDTFPLCDLSWTRFRRKPPIPLTHTPPLELIQPLAGAAPSTNQRW